MEGGGGRREVGGGGGGGGVGERQQPGWLEQLVAGAVEWLLVNDLILNTQGGGGHAMGGGGLKTRLPPLPLLPLPPPPPRSPPSERDTPPPSVAIKVAEAAAVGAAGRSILKALINAHIKALFVQALDIKEYYGLLSFLFSGSNSRSCQGYTLN